LTCSISGSAAFGCASATELTSNRCGAAETAGSCAKHAVPAAPIIDDKTAQRTTRRQRRIRTNPFPVHRSAAIGQVSSFNACVEIDSRRFPALSEESPLPSRPPGRHEPADSRKAPSRCPSRPLHQIASSTRSFRRSGLDPCRLRRRQASLAVLQREIPSSGVPASSEHATDSGNSLDSVSCGRCTILPTIWSRPVFPFSSHRLRERLEQSNRQQSENGHQRTIRRLRLRYSTVASEGRERRPANRQTLRLRHTPPRLPKSPTLFNLTASVSRGHRQFQAGSIFWEVES
jgi:hypothetical protein